MRNRRSRVRFGLVFLLGVAIVACGGSGAGRVGTNTPTQSPEPISVTAGLFVPISRPSLSGRDGADLTVGEHRLLFYGGRAPGVVAANRDGVMYDFTTRAWSVVPDWPYDSAYAPGVVATSDDRFVVLGMPCPSPADDQDATSCGQQLAAAVYDPSTSEWSKLPTPQLGPLDAARKNAVVTGYGVAGTKALFRVGENDADVIAAYDLGTREWAAVPLPDGFALPNHNSISENDPDTEAGADTSVCFVDGALVASRVNEGQHIVLAWRLDHDLAWHQATTLPIPSVGQVVNRFECTDTDLLFIVGGMTIAELRYFDNVANQWNVLRTPPVGNFELGPGTLRIRGTWLVWPATDRTVPLFSFPPDGSAWTETKRPLAALAQLRRIGNAALVYTTDDAGAPVLALYGVQRSLGGDRVP